MEIYIKGKYERGVGSAAYIVVAQGHIVAQGAKNLGQEFLLDGMIFPCDQFNTEILAAICGVARCGGGSRATVFSNNLCVVKWLSLGEEPEGRSALLDRWRGMTAKKDVSVEYIPRYDKDPSGNEWNRLCNELAEEVLK